MKKVKGPESGLEAEKVVKDAEACMKPENPKAMPT